MPIIEVREVEAKPGHRLNLAFSDMFYNATQNCDFKGLSS
jgi:hypothetical protein